MEQKASYMEVNFTCIFYLDKLKILLNLFIFSTQRFDKHKNTKFYHDSSKIRKLFAEALQSWKKLEYFINCSFQHSIKDEKFKISDRSDDFQHDY